MPIFTRILFFVWLEGSMVIKVCLKCSKEFTPKWRMTTGVYCSVECYKSTLPPKAKYMCLVCHKEFFTKASIKRKFCSLVCFFVNHGKNKVWTYTCAQCRNEYPVDKSGHIRKLCAMCVPLVHNKTIADLMQGANDAQNRYNKIRRHAKHILAKSNISKVCKTCGYNKHVEVCHLKPIWSFSKDTPLFVVNASDNLMYLCPNCHWEFDNLDLLDQTVLAIAA